MLCSVTSKNSNWKILTKSLVTFKRWDGAYIGGDHPKKVEGELGQFANLRGGIWQERGGGAGGSIPQCTLCSSSILIL